MENWKSMVCPGALCFLSIKSGAQTLGHLHASCVPAAAICKSKHSLEEMSTFVQDSQDPLAIFRLVSLIISIMKKLPDILAPDVVPRENIQLF